MGLCRALSIYGDDWKGTICQNVMYITVPNCVKRERTMFSPLCTVLSTIYHDG